MNSDFIASCFISFEMANSNADLPICKKWLSTVGRFNSWPEISASWPIIIGLGSLFCSNHRQTFAAISSELAKILSNWASSAPKS